MSENTKIDFDMIQEEIISIKRNLISMEISIGQVAGKKKVDTSWFGDFESNWTNTRLDNIQACVDVIKKEINRTDKKCCICGDNIQVQVDKDGNVVWRDGHNASPVEQGRCCDTCNSESVVPRRMAISRHLPIQ